MHLNWYQSALSFKLLIKTESGEWGSRAMSMPGFSWIPWKSIHGIFQARILEWVGISSSRGSSWPRDQTRVSCVSCTAGRFFNAEPLGKPLLPHNCYQINIAGPTWRDAADMPYLAWWKCSRRAGWGRPLSTLNQTHFPQDEHDLVSAQSPIIHNIFPSTCCLLTFTITLWVMSCCPYKRRQWLRQRPSQASG